MSEDIIPNPPDELKPDVTWEHYELYASVKKALIFAAISVRIHLEYRWRACNRSLRIQFVAGCND